MAHEPDYSGEMGPQAVKPSVLRMVSGQIELYYQMNNGAPKRSEEDEDFWILGMADKDVPPIYKLPKPYAVYTLRCSTLKNSEIRECRDELGISFSDELLNAYALNSAPLTYVGYTKNPYRRLNEHVDPFTTGAEFTDMFPPKQLVQMEWCDSKNEAQKREFAVAKKLRRTQGHFLNPSVLPRYRDSG